MSGVTKIIKSLSDLSQGVVSNGAIGAILWFSFTNGTGISDINSTKQDINTVMVQNYDGEGHDIDLPYVNSQRVLVTYPGATELLITLGLQERVIATIAPYGAEPPELATAYDGITKLEAPFVPTREEVTALKPDLIMGWSHHFQPSSLGDIRNWFGRGVATYIVPATVRKGKPTIESTVYPFIDDVGRIFHIEEQATAYKQGLQDRVQAVADKVAGKSERPSVLILQSYGNSSYSVYGKPYIIDDIVHKAGGQNITDTDMMTVGPERILAYDPDYIVFVVYTDIADPIKFKEVATQALLEDVNLKHMRAVQNKKIVPVPFAEVNNGNGRVVDALETIATGLE